MISKQILLHRDLDTAVEQKVAPVTLKVEIEKQLIVNICSAAEKIEEYPITIQKLVWRALHYKCEIEARLSMNLTSSKNSEKLTKYFEAFKQTQKLILKMCKRQNLRGIVIENGFKKYKWR